MDTTRTHPCSQPQRWSSGSARRPRDHSRPLGSGLAPTERARSRLERSVEASIAHASRAAGCHMPGSALAATPRDQTSGGGAKYGKVWSRWLVSVPIPKNRSCQPRFCTVGRERPNLSTLTSHPCRTHNAKTAAVWCVPALRVPLVHSLINHFRQNTHFNALFRTWSPLQKFDPESWRPELRRPCGTLLPGKHGL